MHLAPCPPIFSNGSLGNQSVITYDSVSIYKHYIGSTGLTTDILCKTIDIETTRIYQTHYNLPIRSEPVTPIYKRKQTRWAPGQTDFGLCGK